LILWDLLDCFMEDTGFPIELAEELLEEPAGQKLLVDLGLDGGLDDEEMDGDSFADWDIPFDAPEPGEKPVAARKHDEGRLKALWRELAFALHPDQSDSGTDPRKQALWHQAQAAMAAGDVDRLEVLHAHVQFMSGELSEAAPVSQVQGLTRMYRESRNALRRKIRELRGTVEWGFAAKGEDARKRVQAGHESKLALEIRAAKALANDLRDHYARVYAPPSKAHPRPPSPREREQLSFSDVW
jgi:hypothetical protein